MDCNKSLDISFVIPIFNEVSNISVLIDYICELESIIKKYNLIKNYEFILIDDGSTDNSAQRILLEIGSKMINDKISLNRHADNFGYGAAIQSGIYISKYDWIIIFDADGQHKPTEIIKIIKQLLNNDRVFLLIGKRQIIASQYYLKRIGRKLLNYSEMLMLGSKIRDSNSGLKCFKKDVYLELEKVTSAPTDMSFSQYLTHMFSLLSVTAVQEVLIENSERHKGDSKILIKDFFIAFYQNLALAYLLKFKRLTHLCSLSLFVVFIPYSGITMFIKNSGIPVAGGIAIILGFILIVLGELKNNDSEKKLNLLKKKLKNKYSLNAIYKI